MSKKRRQHSPDLKAKVGLEALKGIEPVHAIASRYEVHPVQVSQWKKEAGPPYRRLPQLRQLPHRDPVSPRKPRPYPTLIPEEAKWA
jgi:transposase-like protein